MLREKECFNSKHSGNVLSYTQGGEDKKDPSQIFAQTTFKSHGSHINFYLLLIISSLEA